MIIFDRCDSNSIIYLYIAYIKLYCKTPVKFKQKYILEHKQIHPIQRYHKIIIYRKQFSV